MPVAPRVPKKKPVAPAAADGPWEFFPFFPFLPELPFLPAAIWSRGACCSPTSVTASIGTARGAETGMKDAPHPTTRAMTRSVRMMLTHHENEGRAAPGPETVEARAPYAV